MEKAVYDLIGIDYNQTRTADPFLVERLFSLLSPDKNSIILDVGCGTGNYTIALSSKGHSFYGVEPSEIMLNEARRKSVADFWTQAAAESLPFESEFFSGALATLTIHHWKNLETAFAELYRVLKRESNFVLFTAFPEQMQGYWLNHYFPQMLKDSMMVMPSRQKVEDALGCVGFNVIAVEKYFVHPQLQDLFLYSGKQRPSLYFNKQVRDGISSFSALSNKKETEKGLQNLASDLENGNFDKIAQNYENDLGDYCFIVAKKSL